MVAHPCLLPPGHGLRLPAPIVATTDCGAFLANTDGTVERLPRHWLNRHGGGTGRTYGARLQVRFEDRRILLEIGGRVVWRAARVYKDYGGQLAFGPRGRFAFTTYYHGLYLTRRPARERLVLRGKGLYPVGFTPRGDILVALPGTRLWLLDGSGRVVRRIRYHGRNGFAFDERSGTLRWVTPRLRLATLAGRRIELGRRIWSRGSLWLQPGGLLAFSDERSFLVLRPDGQRIAGLRLATGMLDSAFTGTPDGARFAFRVRTGNARVGAPIAVEVLPAGSGTPRILYRHRLKSVGCANGAGFAWHGHELLYTSSDGARVLIDTDTGAVLDLGALARALPHRGSSVSFAWRADYR
jgi:hypothetical protein